MASINERFMDFQVAQQIRWIRMQNREVREALKILNRVDRQLATLLRASDDSTPYTTARLNALKVQVDNLITSIHAQTGAQLTNSVIQAAQTSADIETDLFKRTLPAGLDVTTPNPGVIQNAATLKPFNGAVLGDWIENVKQSDLNRTWRHIQDGLIAGTTTPELIRSLNGTVREVSKRGMEALVRTSINHATNQGRQQMWEANSDIVSSVRWVATLDGRTSPVCRDRDGKVGPVSPSVANWTPPDGYAPLDPPYARPPAHPNCRSTTVAITKSWRELGFDVDDLEPGVRASMDGTVPANMTYYQWLARQNDEVQLDVLGRTRFDLWKSGKVTPDKFYNDKGKYLTITDLRKSIKDDPPVKGIDFRQEIDMSDPLMTAIDVETKIKNVVDMSKYRPTDFGLTTWGDIGEQFSDGLISSFENRIITNQMHMAIIATAEGGNVQRYITALHQRLLANKAIKESDIIGDAPKPKPAPPKPTPPINTPKNLVKPDRTPDEILAAKQAAEDPFFHQITKKTDQPPVPWDSATVVSTVSRSKRLKDRVDDTAFRAYEIMPNWVLNEIGDVYTIDMRKRRANYDFVNMKLNMSYENHWTVWVHEMFHALDFKFRLPRGAPAGRARYEPRDSLDWNTSDPKLNKLAAETRQEFIDRDSKGKGRFGNGDGSYWIGDWDHNYEGRAYSFDQKVSSEYITMAAQEYARAKATPDLPQSKATMKRMEEKQPKMLALLKYIWGDD